MLTLVPSTMTGTDRFPFECFSISSSCDLSTVTSWYCTSYFLASYASRADVVYGQVSFPKMRTTSAIIPSPMTRHSISSVGGHPSR